MAFKAKKHHDDENDVSKEMYDEQSVGEKSSCVEKEVITDLVLPDILEKNDEIEQELDAESERANQQLESLDESVVNFVKEKEFTVFEDIKELINDKNNDLSLKIDELDTKIGILLENRKQGEIELDANIEKVITELIDKVEIVTKNQDRNDKQITKTLRENANFQIQVRQGMQKELDDYKKVEKKEVFVPVLRDLAMTYVGYKASISSKIDEMLNGEQDEMEELLKKIGQLQQLVDTMFDELQEILEDNGAEIVNSTPGEVRKARQCKIMRKIPTGNPSLHDTIARSTRDGVILGRQVLCNEYVDIYIYDKTVKESDVENFEINDSINTKIEEVNEKIVEEEVNGTAE